MEALVSGVPVPLTGAKTRTVLAAFLLSRGRVLSDERLSEFLWGWQPPATMAAQLYTHISRLRKSLGPGLCITRRSRGYHMDLRSVVLDVDTFRRLADEGRQQLLGDRYRAAAETLNTALTLWRGNPLSEVTTFLADAELPHLEECRLAALEDRTAAELALGRHAQVVPELTRLVAEHPGREALRGQLMTALYRCDRQADALRVYEQGRHVLKQELGIDPGVSLRRIHRDVLTGGLPDPPATEAVTLAVPPAAPAPGRIGSVKESGSPWSRLVPAMLPLDAPDFTGRDGQLAEVLEELRGLGPARRGVVLLGRAGMGKSALAVHASYACRQDLPDGQLYIDLGSEDGRPKDPSYALACFLRALLPDRHELPATLDERAQLYRSRLAGSRMLIVLDNAVDDRQVRPLLPGGHGCRTIVTSRRPLTTLEGMRVVRLGALDRAESLRLFRALSGRAQVEAEPVAAARIVELCDGLPLALRVCAARLKAQPQRGLGQLADRLAPEQRRLDELRLGSLDARAGMRATWDGLDRAAAAALGVLSRGGAATWSPPAAARLLRCPEERAEGLLEELAEAMLVEVVRAASGSGAAYRIPSLVRLFAREQPHAVPGSD
ncbi:winged helix-turn-helix domain-containing protein [Streptomyces sp. SCA3-4]|uniref:AfsR/SARP family transcriptional regulator n=1 Tax=Streptomyces sichuanensis TaxID=2871810 RepID=UPI001CE23A20|nr:AfsR/SARP family transcriptional regulator [Streptomyces sichuanensis]MCA6094692.1 winged helix-turn-helix domain-containing protein [Streptomyces sichuanensis]